MPWDISKLSIDHSHYCMRYSLQCICRFACKEIKILMQVIRRIPIYIFCLIRIGLSLSYKANKMKFLNIERALQFHLPLKI